MPDIQFRCDPYEEPQDIFGPFMIMDYISREVYEDNFKTFYAAKASLEDYDNKADLIIVDRYGTEC